MKSKAEITSLIKERNNSIKEVRAQSLGDKTPRVHQVYSVQELLLWAETAHLQDTGKILYLPTGGGKTAAAGTLVKHLQPTPLTCGFYVPTLDLLSQTKERFIEFGLTPFVYHRDFDGFDVPDDARVIISIHNTLCNQVNDGDHRGLADVMIFDECHNTRYQSAFELIVSRGVPIGLSATPWIPELSKYWDKEILIGASHSKLQRDGVLSKADLYGNEDFEDEDKFVYDDGLDAQNATDRFGYETEHSALVFERSMRMMPGELKRHGLDDGCRFLVKCANKTRADMLKKYLEDEGISAEVFNSDRGSGSKTKASLDAIFDRAPDTASVAIVVHQFSIGYDHNRIDGVIFTNNTKFVVFVQTAGRALRVDRSLIGEGKKIIDLAANVAIHKKRFEGVINDPPGEIPDKRNIEKETPSGGSGDHEPLKDTRMGKINLKEAADVLLYIEDQKLGLIRKISINKSALKAVVATAVDKMVDIAYPSARANNNRMEKAQELAMYLFDEIGTDAIDNETITPDNRLVSQFWDQEQYASLFNGQREPTEEEGRVLNEAYRLLFVKSGLGS